MSRQSTHDTIIRNIANAQLGLITVGQAARAGVDRWALERRREAGSLAFVFARVMRVTASPITVEQQLLAAALAVHTSVIAATSAAVVHRLPVGTDIGPPIVTTVPGRSPRTAGIRIVRSRLALPSGRWLSARVATPAAAIVMLPRFVDAAVLERCLDDALARRLTTVKRVARLVESQPPSALAGRRQLVDLLAERSGGIGHRSGLEQRVARWLDQDQLVGWKPNFRVPVGGGRTVEVDFGWPTELVALEISPFFTHGSKAAQQRDVQRRRLLVERGWRVAEASDPDLESRDAFSRCLAVLRLLLAPSVDRGLRAG
jgi:hypothetical protein